MQMFDVVADVFTKAQGFITALGLICKRPEIAPNYTKEMRLVFDEPVRTFDPKADEAKTVRKFYAHVAKALDCPDVLAALT
jgi:hypothetical protein